MEGHVVRNRGTGKLGRVDCECMAISRQLSGADLKDQFSGVALTVGNDGNQLA